jgi:transposase-like protein
MSRKKFTELDKQRWVIRYQSHGANAAAFCREFDLPYGSFMAWRRHYHGKNGSTESATPACVQTPFIEVTVDSPSPQAKGTVSPLPVAELSLGSGIVLRVFTPSHGPA